jgi:hypothetical protein
MATNDIAYGDNLNAPKIRFEQGLVISPDADAAKAYVDRVTAQWTSCAGKALTQDIGAGSHNPADLAVGPTAATPPAS